jgi:hypothetical protein
MRWGEQAARGKAEERNTSAERQPAGDPDFTTIFCPPWRGNKLYLNWYLQCPRHPNRDDRDSKITNVVGFELCMHCSIVVQYFEKRRCLACESIRNRIDSSAIHLALCTLNRFGKCFGSDFWAPRRRHGDHTAAILATDPVEHEDVANSWPSRRMRWPVFMPVLLCVG